jgi:hypothetical protein
VLDRIMQPCSNNNFGVLAICRVAHEERPTWREIGSDNAYSRKESCGRVLSQPTKLRYPPECASRPDSLGFREGAKLHARARLRPGNVFVFFIADQSAHIPNRLQQ